MAKLTKIETKNHLLAMDLINSDKELSFEDKEFVLRNYHEGANHIQGQTGTFFTPYDMAYDVILDIGYGDTVDLCAGIGMLMFCHLTRLRYYHMNRDDKLPRLVCVELNKDYIEVGKRIMPEVEWIHADILNMPDIGKFEYSISNPPFGNIAGKKYFEFSVIEYASTISNYGVFVLPQMSAGFNFSGKRYYERQSSGRAYDFQKRTGYHMEASIGVDTSLYKNAWKGTSPVTEVVSINFEDKGNI